MAIVASGQITLVDLNDTKQLAMYIGASQSKTVVYDGVKNYTPDYSVSNQTLTPQLYVAGSNEDVAESATSCKWYYQTNGANAPIEITADTDDYSLVQVGTSALKALTIKTNLLSQNTSMTYICELIYLDSDSGISSTIKTEIEIVKITNGLDGVSGKDAVIGLLTNEISNIIADSSGNVISYDGVNTQLTIYKGTVDDTANWSINQTRQNVTVSEDVSSRTATITAMSADVGSVTFTATRSGYPTIVKVFKVVKVKSGANGEDAISYNLIVSTPVLSLNKTRDAFNPINISVSATFQVGSAEPFDYPTMFTVEETLDGSTYTVKYTSSANEYSFVYTPSSYEVKSLRVNMYLENGTTTLLDQQVIPVVYDGADAIYVNVWTPDGNAIKNGEGTIVAQADLYHGVKTITASSYKWYVQDETATTTSGGDNDGGNGWRLLNDSYNLGTSGYKTAKLTIPPTAIVGSEAFKSVVVYNGNNYYGVTTVVDLSDPYQIRLDGMDKFKNGEGIITVRATILKSGEEIDPDGSGKYTYHWYIYDASNNKTSFVKSGKTITINATDISGRGNLVCEVYTV
ncbi:hypothetical protein [Bacillus mojavensis]